MIEESAFWTRDLQKASGTLSWFVFAGVLALSLFMLAISLPYTDNQHVLLVARVTCTILTFMITTEFYGAAKGYSRTARALERLLLRIDGIIARGYPEADVLLILSDYNAVVETAPLSIPGMYQMRKDKLNKLWIRYKAGAVAVTPLQP